MGTLNSEGKYEWQTYGAVHDRIADVALGIAELGLIVDDRVAVWGVNRAEWVSFRAKTASGKESCC